MAPFALAEIAAWLWIINTLGLWGKVRLRRINLEGNTHTQEINVSQCPVQLSLSQPAKTLGPSYYCLYSLFNKIRDKGKIVSAW
jgi:hypothetical protein